MSLFETYEPHTEYLSAVMLRPENFDALADELSRSFGGYYLVSKTIRYGEPYMLTLTTHGDDDPVTCRMYQMFVQRRGKPLEVMDRHDVRNEWRKVACDPYRE